MIIIITIDWLKPVLAVTGLSFRIEVVPDWWPSFIGGAKHLLFLNSSCPPSLSWLLLLQLLLLLRLFPLQIIEDRVSESVRVSLFTADYNWLQQGFVIFAFSYLFRSMSLHQSMSIASSLHSSLFFYLLPTVGSRSYYDTMNNTNL